MRQSSLKWRLVLWLLPMMATATGASLWMTRVDAAAAANLAYDRSLLGAIKAIDANVSFASGGLAVELPYRLFEFFQLTASGNVHFRVATADGLVEIGSPDLPMPSEVLRAQQPVFFDASYFDESVRVGVLMRPLQSPVAGAEATQLIIQVAESTASRDRFTQTFLRQALARDFLLSLLTCLVVMGGLGIALRPLTRLARETRERGDDDLRPLPAQDLPADLRPLVDAVNQQLLRVEKLTTQRRQFVDDASHQLRTPLTVLRAQMDFILREPDPHAKAEALQALSDELNHTARATQQLLTLARSDAASADKVPFDLAALVRELAIELLPLAKARRADLGVDNAEQALRCMGDPDLLRHALLNIAHNALVHGHGQQGAGASVTLVPSIVPGGVRVAVIDDGGGIDPQVLQRIGQRFVKGRASRGSGLGMAIAQAVMHSHGGCLRVGRGAQGRGSVITLEWPQ